LHSQPYLETRHPLFAVFLARRVRRPVLLRHVLSRVIGNRPSWSWTLGRRSGLRKRGSDEFQVTAWGAVPTPPNGSTAASARHATVTRPAPTDPTATAPGPVLSPAPPPKPNPSSNAIEVPCTLKPLPCQSRSTAPQAARARPTGAGLGCRFPHRGRRCRRRAGTGPDDADGRAGQLPWFFASDSAAVWWSVALTCAASLLVGGALGRGSSGGVRWSALRQLLIVVVASAITYGVGAVAGTAMT